MKNSNKKKYTMQGEVEPYSDSRIFDVEENLYNNPQEKEILTFDQKIMQKNKIRDNVKMQKRKK